MKQMILLSVIMFLSNALIMVFEIIGIRILAPYTGTSILVWSSVIGIILFFLSLGNYYGGRVADVSPKVCHVRNIFFITGILIYAMYLFKDILLYGVYGFVGDIGWYILFVSALLFGPISFLLGMISSLLMKIAVDDLSTTGIKVGWIGAMGSLGGILGTLGAGFILVPLLGIQGILLSLVVVSFGTGLLSYFLDD